MEEAYVQGHLPAGKTIVGVIGNLSKENNHFSRQKPVEV